MVALSSLPEALPEIRDLLPAVRQPEAGVLACSCIADDFREEAERGGIGLGRRRCERLARVGVGVGRDWRVPVRRLGRDAERRRLAGLQSLLPRVDRVAVAIARWVVVRGYC